MEPPNWWIGHSVNPVRLLISGSDLEGVRVGTPPGFIISAQRVTSNGRHLFMDLQIPSQAKPGKVDLRFIRDGVTNQIPFELLEKPARESQGLSSDDVVYLIMIDRFSNGDSSNDDPAISPGLHDRARPRRYHGGDFQGIINHLNYLKELGVTALWLTPWYDNVNHLNEIQSYSRDHKGELPVEPSADYHGYGVVDFYATEEHFGNLAKLKQLVDLAHATGLKVMQDQVVNLTSPYHPWLENLPSSNWFNGTTAYHLTNTFQTWRITVSNPPPDQLRCTLEGWFFNYLPDLNQNDPEVATYLIQNSLWWLDSVGVDAIRQDALPYVPRPYWARWSAALKREQPQLKLVGEMWDGNPQRVAFFQGGAKRFDGVDSGVDTLFDFPLYYAMREVFAQNQPISKLTEILASDTNYLDAVSLVTFVGLHDQPRFLSEPGATVAGLKLAFTFLLTTRGMPLIYYGDEIGMRGEGDPDNRRDFPGGWSEDPQSAFTAVGRTPEQAEIYAHVAKLLKLRKNLAALRHGRIVNLLVKGDVYAFARVEHGEYVVVFINNSRRPQYMEASLGALKLAPDQILKDQLGTAGDQKISDQMIRVMLPPRSAALFTPLQGQTSR